MTGPLQASTQLTAAVRKVDGALETATAGLKRETAILRETSLCTGWWMAEQELVMPGRVQRSRRVKRWAFASVVFGRQRR